jgi:hypothetical protein
MYKTGKGSLMATLLLNPATATMALLKDERDDRVADPLLDSFFSLMYGCDSKPTANELIENDNGFVSLEKQWSNDSG